jgi:hypothetical protein
VELVTGLFWEFTGKQLLLFKIVIGLGVYHTMKKSGSMWSQLGNDTMEKIQRDRDLIVRDMVREGLSERKVLGVFANWLKDEIRELYVKHKEGSDNGR